VKYLRQKTAKALAIQEAGDYLDIDLSLHRFMPDEWEQQKWLEIQRVSSKRSQ
jgi:hypothetical protein